MTYYLGGTFKFFFGDTSVSPVSAPTPRRLFAPAIRFVAGPSYRVIVLSLYRCSHPVDTSIRRYVDTSIRRYVDTSIRRYVDTSIRRYCYALFHVERRNGVTYCRHRRHDTLYCHFRYCGKSLVKNPGHCSKSEQGATARRRTLRAGPPGRRAAGPS